jgi:hypothetical protein
MRIRAFTALVVGFVALGATRIAAQAASQGNAKPDVTPFLIADRDAEIRLARTAAPPSIADSATVLVLERTGYVQATRGSNGFTCVVIRSLAGNLEAPGLWSPQISAPHCFNPQAARTVMPTLLKQTEWLLSGQSASEVGARIERSYANRELSPPASGSMAYMLSPEQRLTESGSHGLPHLMFFYDKSQPASAWGAGASGSPVLNDPAGDAQAPFITLFIVVRQWSNGTPATSP